jgi:hypothetical protein
MCGLEPCNEGGWIGIGRFAEPDERLHLVQIATDGLRHSVQLRNIGIDGNRQ